MAIARGDQAPQPGKVVLSLGAGSNTDSPMPDLRAGDLLRVYVELEVTTDAPYQDHPGRIGKRAYDFAPRLDARLLLAADRKAAAPQRGRAVPLGRWTGECSHAHHHRVIVLAEAYRVPAAGVEWPGASCVNVTLGAAHPKASGSGENVVLVGENEKVPKVDQDTGGIRVVRLRPADQAAIDPVRETKLRRKAGVPVAKRPTVMLSRKLTGVQKGEQLFVHGRLITDAGRLGYKTRITTRLFLADDPKQVEPAGHAQRIASWKGHLSKPNGFNCLSDEGPRRSEKFGVLRARESARQPVYVNLVAVSAAPDRDPPETGDDLPVERGSFLEVVRYPAELGG